MLTINSKLKDVFANPVGHDVICKILLQMNQSEHIINNPLIGNMRLATLKKLAGQKIGAGFFETLLTLLNSEPDIPAGKDGPTQKKWWKEAVFYQIYPRSFNDSNQDGIGDIPGITGKLDYLKELGVDVIWLSPVYDSPNDDNGYDIRDYYKIMEDFGSMEDFDCLLEGIHSRGMRLIMDLVINHTSDEHAWFQEALRNPESGYREYYHFVKGEKGREPNNWTSFFSGSAWNYYEEQDVWALHLFSKKQMDLNWESKELQADIIKMIKWWLEKGVDGFRMDVINYISKAPGLPEGDRTIGDLMGYCGIEHYFYGPELHSYLRQMKEKAFAPYDAFSVGEMPGVGMEMGKLLTGDDRGELDMFFSFDHLENPGKTRFDEYAYDLNYLKKDLIHWTRQMGCHCWQTLFYNNHDNPRFISKVNPDSKFRDLLAKLLVVIQMTSKGTPFLFQGDEIGLINKKFSSIQDIRDIESLNLYRELKDKVGEEDAFKKILAGTRDHARTPMQWTAEVNGGFTQGTPWIVTDEDYKERNVEEQLAKNDSVLQFYKKIILLRKQNTAFIYGESEFIKSRKKDYFLYFRTDDRGRFYIECNLSAFQKPRINKIGNYEKVLSNYEGEEKYLRPYEVNVYRCIK